MRKIAVFVIAHPDDESMFFLPTICSLSNHATKCWLLCLSNGNYDGLGKTREIELHRVGGYLGLDRVIIINHEELNDSPTRRWSKEVVAHVLEENLSDADQVDIYTFDEGGVSGHINHVDTYLGVQYYLQQLGRQEKKTTRAFQLTTVSGPIQKYLPLRHWIMLLLTLLGLMVRTAPTPSSTYCCTLYTPWVNWKCMAGHTSQFVWYRRLFVAFSCYTYENRWQPIPTTTS